MRSLKNNDIIKIENEPGLFVVKVNKGKLSVYEYKPIMYPNLELTHVRLHEYSIVSTYNNFAGFHYDNQLPVHVGDKYITKGRNLFAEALISVDTAIPWGSMSEVDQLRIMYASSITQAT